MNTQTREQGENKTDSKLLPLKLREIIAYGSGDFGFAMVSRFVDLFLLFFFTDIYGISAAQAGSIFLIARIWDAVIDPPLGFIADRTETRWGKYRPYLLFGAIPLAIFNVMLFITPDYGATGKYFYALIMFLLYDVAFSATNLSYGSMTAVITQNQVERTSLAASRMFFGMPAIVFISVFTPIVVSHFPNKQTGYPAAVAIYSILAVLLIWLVFFTVKERVNPEKREPYPLSEVFSMIRKNTVLLHILSAIFLVGAGMTVRMMMAKYYFDYNMKSPELFTVFMIIIVPTMMIGALLSAVLNKKLSKKNLYNVGMVLYVIGDIGIYFSPYSAVTSIMAFAALAGLGTGISYTLIWSLVADAVEFGEWKTGRRAEGMTYASYTFTYQLSNAVGGALGGFMLAAAGYVPHAIQTLTADHAIRFMFAIVPAITGILTFIIMFYYKLDKEAFAKIIADLEKRRGAVK